MSAALIMSIVAITLLVYTVACICLLWAGLCGIQVLINMLMAVIMSVLKNTCAQELYKKVDGAGLYDSFRQK